MLDISPAARQMAAVITGVRDEQLGNRTPCPDYSVGDLVEHVGGLAVAFTAAATKNGIDDIGRQPPEPDAARLPPDWRERIPRALDRLAAAWSDPAAWTGMTRAGGVDLPGEVGGMTALDEIVLHGWDLAQATGQPFDVDAGLLRAVHGFLGEFSGPGHDEERAGLFGPEVQIPASAPMLDRVLGMAGREPTWSPHDRGSDGDAS
jgi:uncharacterized protein (TIGR03086 family)